MKASLRDQINKKYEILENLKDLLVINVSKLSQEKLLERPTPNSWNLIEFASHLMYVEDYALTQIRNSLNQKIKKSVVDRIRFFLVRRILSLDIKIKVPIKEVDPSDCDNNLDNIFSKWGQCRLDFRELINNFSDNDLSYCYCYHPYAGNFTMCDGLTFLIDHWHHHQKQLDRLLDL